MKILYVLGKDVYNIPAVNIIKEFKQRGHLIELYALYKDNIHIRMFHDMSNEIKDFYSLNESIINSFDIIFSGFSLTEFALFKDIKKYVFIYSTCYMDEIYTYGDFTFGQRQMNHYIIGPDYGVDVINQKMIVPNMAVGNPKFDPYEAETESTNTILFVDSGHYPYGSEAKHELSKLLLSICDLFPDHKIVIKPRFLPNDKNVTHRNEDFLYNHIIKDCNGNLPSNLTMLKEHTDLSEWIKISKTIITTYSSSYLDVAVAKKGGLIIEGLPSKESTAQSKEHLERMKIIMSRSGCMVNYKEIPNLLPDGLICYEQHINEMVYSTTNCSKKIVDAVEYLYENFISLGLFPKNSYYNSDNYRQLMTVDNNLTWEHIIHRRYKNELYGFVFFIYDASDKIDFSSVIEYIDNINILLNKNNITEYKTTVNKMVTEIMLNSKDLLNETPYKQCHLLTIMFNNGILEEFDESDILCKDYYNYLKGKLEYNKKNFSLACNYLLKYLDGIKNNLYGKTMADFEENIVSANFYIAMCYYYNNDFNLALNYFYKCQELTQNHHLKAYEYICKLKNNNLSLD